MKRFYERRELTFAILLIVVYVIAAGNMRSNFGDESIQMLLTLAVLSVFILWFVLKNGLSAKYGMTAIPAAKPFLFFIPLVILAVSNLFPGIRPAYSGTAQIFAVLSMALVGFLEEMIFRGFLFEAIAKESRTRAIIISALTFGAGHIVNLFTGQATAETLIQIVYACAIGFAFAMVYDRGGSILPCIITHSLVDVTSEFSDSASPLAPAFERFTPIFITVLSLAYALYILKKVPRKA